MVKVKVKQQTPAGSYPANFFGAQETQHAEYGPGLVWTWQITAGPRKGELVTRRTATPATSRNATGKFLVAMTEQPLEKLDDAELEDYVGTRCLIVVTVNGDGWPRVESFIKELKPDAMEAKAPDAVPF
jgi:hypothetical protein